MGVKPKEQINGESNPTEQSYEHTRSKLVIAYMPFTTNNANTEQLNRFVTAALALHNACNNDSIPENPIDVLFWLRQRLNQEAKNSARNNSFRSQCRHQSTKIERMIATSIVALSQGRLTAMD